MILITIYILILGSMMPLIQRKWLAAARKNSSSEKMRDIQIGIGIKIKKIKIKKKKKMFRFNS